MVCYDCIYEIVVEVNNVIFVEDFEVNMKEIYIIFYDLEKIVVCCSIIVGNLCIDGCEKDMVCVFDVCIGIFFCIYGFVLFICGEI